MKNVQENAPNKFYSALALWPPSEGQVKCEMVAVNGACKHGRYEKKRLNSLRVMSNVKVFPM